MWPPFASEPQFGKSIASARDGVRRHKKYKNVRLPDCTLNSELVVAACRQASFVKEYLMPTREKRKLNFFRKPAVLGRV